LRHWLFADDTRRAIGKGFGDIIMAIGLFPAHRDKQIARANFPRVKGHAMRLKHAMGFAIYCKRYRFRGP
jgi:hypothetical protein